MRSDVREGSPSLRGEPISQALCEGQLCRDGTHGPWDAGVQASARALGEEGEATLSQIPLLETGHFLGV